MNAKVIILMVCLFSLVSCSGDWHDERVVSSPPVISNAVKAEKNERILISLAEQYPNSDYDAIMKEAAKVHCYSGKSLAYLGASLVNLPECDLARYMVEKAFGCEVTAYGHGGYGYASSQNLQDYARNMNQHDVYIIWGTTNDYSLDVSVGGSSDYTEEDGYDESKLNTACGGMNYVIVQARRINPKAIVLGYSTVKIFNGLRLDGSMRNSAHTNLAGYHFFDYVDAQLACFERQNVPCLNVWDWEYFTHSNWTDHYQEDGTHLLYSGYFFLAMEHIKFLTKIAHNDFDMGVTVRTHV